MLNRSCELARARKIRHADKGLRLQLAALRTDVGDLLLARGNRTSEISATGGLGDFLSRRDLLPTLPESGSDTLPDSDASQRAVG